MLNSIKIQNYRNLKHLSIEKLGRVNLIIGKNNTGKTSLLEGFHILLCQGQDGVIDDILLSRQEKYKTLRHIQDEIEELSGIFYERNQSNKLEFIGTMNGEDTQFSIRFIKYFENVVDFSGSDVPEIISNILPKMYKVKTESTENRLENKIGLEISRNNEKYIRSFEENDILDNMAVALLNGRQSAQLCNFVSASGVADDINLDKWWSKVALTDEEDIVVNALKIVEKNIVRISIIKENQDDETRFVVRLANQQKPFPLRSMGDGINRILTIILAMVNCKDGYLLIDEFENGLHYSVQEKLWEIIFHLAERLNIQVFATTHSNDTIRAFENIVNKNETQPLDGLLIKLENIDDNIESLVFEPDELKVITDNLIEVRR
jgi:AAA15 family ATPase/GTPase